MKTENFVRYILYALLLICLPQRGLAAEKVTVATARTISDAGLYMAAFQGWFKDEGIDLDLIGFDSSTKMIAPLGVGDLDVGGGTVSAGLYNAVSRGIKIRIVADKGSIKPGYAFGALMVRKDLVESGRYKDYKDLKGMKVAVIGNGTSNSSALNEALKRGGHRFEDAESIELAFPQMIAALRNKAIDAAMMTEPSITGAVDSGVAVKVADYNDFYPGQQTSVLLYSEKFMTQRRETAQKFMRAYVKGLRFYYAALKDGRIAGENAEKVIDILTKNTGIRDPAVYRKLAPSGIDPDGRIATSSLRNDLAFFKRLKLVDNPDITVDDIMDQSFVDNVIKDIGAWKDIGARKDAR
jgi:NitT/TauT family transport system substrate-binding protein